MERTLTSDRISAHGSGLLRQVPCGLALALALALELALSVSSFAGEVTLQLRSGDKVTGVILSESDGRIRLRHPLLGVIRVPSSEVTQRIDGSAASLAITAPTPSTPATAPGAMAAKPNLPPSPKAATPVKPPAPKRWSFDLQAGIDLGFGATERQLYNARGRVAYSKDKLRNSFDGLLTYGKTAGVKSADRLDGSMKTDYDVAGRMFLYNLGGVGYDSIRNINLRYEIGPGVGYHLLKKERMKLNAELGANYQAQFNNDATKSESFFYRIAEDCVWQITPKLTLEQRFEFFPGISEFERYRARFEGTVRYSLRSNLYLNLTLLDIYDNRPARTISPNDLQVRSSVGVRF